MDIRQFAAGAAHWFDLGADAETQPITVEQVDALIGAGGAAVKVASSRGDDYQHDLHRRNRDLMVAAAEAAGPRGARRKVRRGKGTQALLNKIDPVDEVAARIEALAEHILLDWRGLVSDGQPFPCTPENKRLLLARTLFREDIEDFADWLESTEEADLGNSGNSPPPGSGTRS